MGFATKSVRDEPSDDDGYRVLVDRLWPRGVSKERAALDAWLRELSPSDDLRRWFDHDPDRWDGFRERYGAELAARPDAAERMAELAERASRGTVTLLFGSREARYNNARALQEFLSDAGEADR